MVAAGGSGGSGAAAPTAASRRVDVEVDLDAASGRAVASGSVFSTILLNHAIRSCGAPRARRVLDVGCGESPYRDLLQPDTYVGLDRTPRTRAGDPAAIADAGSLPVRSGWFDGVLCTEVIEHVPDERALARELARVAAPGAVLVLTSPFVHGLHEVPYDYRRLTSIGLAEVLESAGWAVERMGVVGGPLVVSLDTFARWANRTVRGVASRALRPGAAPFRRVVDATAGFQRVLASLVLRALGRQFGAIDPYSPAPRLTLGYVVVARRRDDG